MKKLKSDKEVKTDLFHCVAVADGDGVVFEGVKIDGDTQRCADFVFAAVAFADTAGFVE